MKKVMMWLTILVFIAVNVTIVRFSSVFWQQLNRMSNFYYGTYMLLEPLSIISINALFIILAIKKGWYKDKLVKIFFVILSLLLICYPPYVIFLNFRALEGVNTVAFAYFTAISISVTLLGLFPNRK